MVKVTFMVTHRFLHTLKKILIARVEAALIYDTEKSDVPDLFEKLLDG